MLPQGYRALHCSVARRRIKTEDLDANVESQSNFSAIPDPTSKRPLLRHHTPTSFLSSKAVKSISKETTVTHFIHRDNARENTAVINGAVQAANREDLRCIQRVNFRMMHCKS
jgi:hypothetical protein